MTVIINRAGRWAGVDYAANQSVTNSAIEQAMVDAGFAAWASGSGPSNDGGVMRKVIDPVLGPIPSKADQAALAASGFGVIHEKPAGFVMPSQLSGLKVYSRGNRFHTNITPESLIDTTAYVQTYYVDSVGGNDANSGLTWALRKKTIGNAARAASASGIASRILVDGSAALPYYRQRSLNDDNIARVSAVPLLIEAINARVVTGPFDNLTWTKTGGATYTYQAAFAFAIAARNTVVLDKNGMHTRYAWVASSAAVDTTEGSWYTDGTTVWIHPHNHDEPDIFNARVDSQSISASWNCNQNLILRGFDFEGGIEGAANIKGGSTNIIITDDCSFRYAWGSNIGNGGTTYATGIRVSSCGLYAAFDCRADRNSRDGFGFVADAGPIPGGLLVNCRGWYNGDGASQSNNGYTSHEGVKSISIGGDWRYNYGTGSGHVNDNTQAWAVGDVSGASIGDIPKGGGINYGAFGAWTGAATQWLDSCRDVGSLIGTYSSGASKIYIRNHRGSGQRVATEAY